MKDRSDDPSHHEQTLLRQSYFSFQPVLHDWCNKGRGMCFPVCGMVHIKEPLLLIGKSSPCGGNGFPLSLSEWSFTICPTPYNHKSNAFSASLNKTFLSLSLTIRMVVNHMSFPFLPLLTVITPALIAQWLCHCLMGWLVLGSHLGICSNPEQVFKDLKGRCMATTPSSFSLTSNRVTTNC